MKNIIVTTLVLLLSFSTQAKKPKWVSDISKGCKKKRELCAVGEGESRNIAKRNARIALSKIFDTQISSKFKSSLSSGGGKISEEMSEDIEEITQTALEGVEIKKTYEGKLNIYALAVINKKKAAKGFKREIQKLDSKMKVLADDGSNSSMMKLEPIFIKRETLHKRYAFLTGRSITSPVSYEQVFKGKKEASQNMVVHIYLDEDEPKSVEGAVAKALSGLGYRTTSGRVRNKKSTHIVTGSYVAEKQYMNVAGFEKYRFELKIKASTAKRVESGNLTFSTIETGRSFSQATSKALAKVQEYIKANIKNLNIE